MELQLIHIIKMEVLFQQPLGTELLHVLLQVLQLLCLLVLLEVQDFIILRGIVLVRLLNVHSAGSILYAQMILQSNQLIHQVY